MRHALGVVAGLCVSCGFDPTGGQIIDQGSGFDGEIVGGSTSSRGAIEPETYFVGGLHARAYRNLGVTLTTTSLDLATLFTQPLGEVNGLYPQNWGADASTGYPRGLGCASADGWSLVVDGEIYLPAGTSSYQLVADDAGFFEITIDDAVSSVHGDYSGPKPLTVTTMHEGWYAIRGAMSESYGTASFALLMPDNTNFPGRYLRSRTTDQRGLMAFVYAFEELEYYAGVWFDHGPIDHAPFVMADWGYATTMSVRFAGQLLIDAPGRYAMDVSIGGDSDDGYRLWIDGQLVADHWLTMSDSSTPVTLDAGWHTIAIDYGNNTGTPEVHLTMDDVVVAADHLRPAVAWGFPAPQYATTNAAVPWSATTPAVYAMGTTPLMNETIDTVDVEYVLTGERTGLTATLDSDGVVDPIAIRAQVNEGNIATYQYDYDAKRTAFEGMPLTAPWHFTVTPNGQAGTVTAAVVSAFFHGGPKQPFSPQINYTSMPRDISGVKELELMHVEAQLAGTTMVISVRTADSAAQLAAQPWTTIPNDSVPSVAARDFFQYQLAITSDGWAFPSVASVRLDYHK